jgi:hypothetical protein
MSPRALLPLLAVVLGAAACLNTEYLVVDRPAQDGEKGADGEDGEGGEEPGDDETPDALWQLMDRPWVDGDGTETPIAAAIILVPLQTEADCAVWPPNGEHLRVVVALPIDETDRTGDYAWCSEESAGLGWYQQRCFQALRESGASGADVAFAGDTLEITAWDELGLGSATLRARDFPTTSFTATRCQ